VAAPARGELPARSPENPPIGTRVMRVPGRIGSGDLSLGWKNLLNAHLVDEVLATQIGQMRPFLVVCEIGADSIDHHHHEGTIIHIHPIRTANEFVVAVAHKRAVNINAKVRLIKARHRVRSLQFVEGIEG
jgi:hypothetical protein